MFISFLGLGAGGGNFADEAARNGFYSASINYSQRDLDSLEHVELKLKLVGSEGVGKQRSEAIRLMNNNWDLAINFVKENFSHSSIEIVFVPFATGGGSGSGIAPVLLNLLIEEMPDKVFVAMPIIPDKKESYINQRNCLETFEDLSQLNVCVLPIDNDKGVSSLINVGKNNLYRSINEHVIYLISKLVSYTDKHSKYGVLDRKDLRNIFATKGFSTIAEVSINNNYDISETLLAENIRRSWEKSFFADVEFNQVVSSGVIFNGCEEQIKLLSMEKIFHHFENKLPINLFEGYYNEGNGEVMTVLSGLPLCHARLNEIEDILETTTAHFNNINKPNTFKSKIAASSRLNLDQSTTSPQTEKKVNDISNIINRFKR